MNKEIKELIEKIEQWAEERNLIEGSTPQGRFSGLMEQFGNLCGSVERGELEAIKKHIFNCFVAVVILNCKLGGKVDLLSVIKSKTTTLSGYYNITILQSANVLGALADSIGLKNSKFNTELSKFLYLLIELAENLNLDFSDCIQRRYNQIKDQKCKILDSIPFKEEDL